MTNSNPIKISKIDISNNEFEIRIRYDKTKLPKNMLIWEETIQEAANYANRLVMEEAFEEFDADGSHIQLANTKYYSCGKRAQVYETSFGPVEVERYVYQNSQGGKTFCPLENDARMILNSTPKYAMMVSSKMVEMAAPAVQRDLRDNHGRSISTNYIKKISDTVGTFAQEKEKIWSYVDPIEVEEEVETLSLGIDGTCMFLMNGGGWREAMVASISMYNKEGERLHTILLGAAPQYGKEDFYARVDAEWQKAKARYPNAQTQGLADGAACNWIWLNERTDIQVLDFYHLSEYVKKASAAIFKPSEVADKNEWEHFWLHRIKHSNNGVPELIQELETHISKPKQVDNESLRRVLEYLKNQAPGTLYLNELNAKRPIGSGITETACKTLIKARMCQSGMRWKQEGASNIIAIRSLHKSEGRWTQFWDKIMKYGFTIFKNKKNKNIA
jgi:hypothetical protein